MATEMGEEASTATDLPDILKVVEGRLIVDTDDDVVANVACWGFRYLLALEFSRQQPALALLYNLEIEFYQMERGSRKCPFRIIFRLKRHIALRLNKAEVIAVICGVLALPGAFNETKKLYDHLFDTTQTRLEDDLPHCSPVIEYVVRPPDDREILGKSGRFDL